MASRFSGDGQHVLCLFGSSTTSLDDPKDWWRSKAGVFAALGGVSKKVKEVAFDVLELGEEH